MRRADDRGHTLLELAAVLVVVGIAAGLVLPRLPHGGALRARAAGDRLATRLTVARERAILDGRPVRVDLGDGLPDGVRIAAVDLGGTPAPAPALVLDGDGDPLPARVTLADESGARVVVLLPAGFATARATAEEAAP